MAIYLITIALIFLPTTTTEQSPSAQINQSLELIIWNVGQGQWVTFRDSQTCIHLDMGGEFNPTNLVRKICSNKTNQIALSHWDSDHIGFVKKFKRLFPDSCLYKIPKGIGSLRKKQWIAGIKTCPHLENAEEIEFAPRKGKSPLTANEQSRVFLIPKMGILAPGDSTKRQEKTWSQDSKLKNIIGLILGHHGSATSTSALLIGNLPNLKWAVASARFARYGHPHPATVNLLRRNHIPLIKTEDWGHLHFYFSRKQTIPLNARSKKANPSKF